MSAPSLAIAVAIYAPEQYARLLATAEDASDLEATWQEWHQVLQDTRRKMAALGMYLVDVAIDLDELEAYCQQRDFSIRAAHALSMPLTCCLNSISNTGHLCSSERRKRSAE